MNKTKMLLIVLAVFVSALAFGQATTQIDKGVSSVVNGVIYLTSSGTYPCTDAGLVSALAALPSNGGLVDYSGCSSMTFSNSSCTTGCVATSAGQTVRGSLGTKIQASSASAVLFSVGVDSHIRDVWFDCGNQPSFTGNVFSFTGNYRDGNNTDVGPVKITCVNVTGGNGAYLYASSGTQSIYTLKLHDWNVEGLHDGVLVYATGSCSNCFINGVMMSNMQWSYPVNGWEVRNGGGQINANVCANCSFQAGGSTNAGWYFDGTYGAYDQAGNNIWIGSIWDATTPISYANNSAVKANLFMGFTSGTISDPGKYNLWWQPTNGMFLQFKPLTAGIVTATQLNQYGASQKFASTCSFSSSTTCSVTYSTYGLSFTNTPLVFLQPVNPGTVTFALTSTTNTGFTITASTSNSLAVNWIVVGNLN